MPPEAQLTPPVEAFLLPHRSFWLFFFPSLVAWSGIRDLSSPGIKSTPSAAEVWSQPLDRQASPFPIILRDSGRCVGWVSMGVGVLGFSFFPTSVLVVSLCFPALAALFPGMDWCLCIAGSHLSDPCVISHYSLLFTILSI